jgi:hypothetical protein
MKKAKITMVERYGAENSMQSFVLKEKTRNTNQKRYRFDNASSSPTIRKRVVDTYLRNYGVEHPMQNSEHYAAHIKKLHHTYSMEAFGKTFSVQGYEDMAMHYLLKWGIPVKYLVCEKMRNFIYTQNKVEHYYYPDLRIRHNDQKLYIEVKSAYTAGLEKGTTVDPVVLSKGKAVVKAGYLFLLLVMRPNKDSSKVKGERKGSITHFILSTPKKPDWELHTGKRAKQEMKNKILKWINN